MNIEYLLKKKEQLDRLWDSIPKYSKYDRFASRELRNAMIKTEELKAYEEYENTFLAMVRFTFSLRNPISLSEAYDLIEEKIRKK